MEAGIQGFAINGATGECCLTTEREFEALMHVVAEVTQGRANFIAGIGTAGHQAAIALAKVAGAAGASGLLLSMPYFFPYSQSDLAAYSRKVAASVDTPVLLYNLPKFTSALEPSTSVALIEECDNIVGIKDSSGSLDTLRLLTERGGSACRIVGNDSILAQGLKERVVDGVVSGVACVLPELIQQMFHLGSQDAGGAAFGELEARLVRFIDQIGPLPVPWGLKVVGEARGLAPATFSQPVSDERQQEIAALTSWLQAHLSELVG